MKEHKVTYWISTSFVALVIGISGLMAITHARPLMNALAHLGYPAYFSNILGIGKVLGVVVLLMPRSAKLKEWAYVGCAITVISAVYSHLNAGDGWMAVDPLATFAALVISYRTRPADRRFSFAQTGTTPDQRISRATAPVRADG